MIMKHAQGAMRRNPRAGEKTPTGASLRALEFPAVRSAGPGPAHAHAQLSRSRILVMHTPGIRTLAVARPP